MKTLIDLLCSCWVYDIQVLSNPWVLFTVVPTMLYTTFMIFKWVVIMAPIWIPICLVIETLVRPERLMPPKELKAVNAKLENN